jgi:hypothetical protein
MFSDELFYCTGTMLIRVLQEHPKQLAKRTNATVRLAIREGRNALFVDHVATNHVIAVSGQTGGWCRCIARHTGRRCSPASIATDCGASLGQGRCRSTPSEPLEC